MVPVKVFGCTGSSYKSIIMQGIDYAVTNCNGRDCVANMSLGGGLSLSQNQAVADAVNSGVVMVTSAGNDYAVDACTKSPASEPLAITVGATTKYDIRSSYSNIGTCVDIFAPGSSIQSASYSGDASYTYKSGTSMACPHVSGAVACYLGKNPGALPSAVTSFILDTATNGILSDVGAGSPNKLLYVGQADAPPTTTQATTTQATTTQDNATTTTTTKATTSTEATTTTTTKPTTTGPTTTTVCTCDLFSARRGCNGACDGTCAWFNKSCQAVDCAATKCEAETKRTCNKHPCCVFSRADKACISK